MVNDPIILLNGLKISSPLADPRRQRHAALHAVRAPATNLSDVAYWPMLSKKSTYERPTAGNGQ
jgi:hypothetical protein